MSGPLSMHVYEPYNSLTITNGMPTIQPSQTSFTTASISEEAAKKIASLQAKLDRKLGPEYISQRPGPGGGSKLTYVEGWKVINLANEVFGFNGWSSSIVSLSTDFADYSEDTKRYCIGVTAIMRVTLRDGVYHEDIGYGTIENTRSKGAGLDKCKKEAVTDGLKRALRNFGNVLGNCLYDKAYTAEVVKMKVEPPKLNAHGLHRRPEFEDVKPKAPTISAVNQIQSQARLSNNNATPSRAPVQENRFQGQMPFKLPYAPAQPITPATTPLNNAHRPPQQDKQVSLSNVPTAPQPEGAASSSTKTLTRDVDFNSDTFGLNDEEFLALADVAADPVRPIRQDDIGRQNNQQDTPSRTAYEAKKIETDGGLIEQQGTVTPENDVKMARNVSREAIIAAALQAQDNAMIRKENSGQTTTTVASASRQLPQPQPAATVVSTAPSAGSTSSSTVADAQQHCQITAPSMAQRLYQNYLKQRKDVKYPTHQNQKQQDDSSIPVTKSTLIPMGGGFNFSSNMKATASSTTSTVIGVKRPAEVMCSGLGSAAQDSVPSSFKGGRPGMGLQQAISGASRHNVGADIADREDVKRVKL